jgi:tetratricopeptide (TPR) repeat protein
MAHICDGQGDRLTATQYYQQSVEIYNEIGDLWAITHPLCDLAWKIWDQGDIVQARKLIENYLEAFRRTRSFEGVEMALLYLASMAAAQGDFETARQAATERSMIIRGSNHREAALASLHGIADVEFLLGNLFEARRYLQGLIEELRPSFDSNLMRPIYILMSLVESYAGNPDLATRFLEQVTSKSGDAMKDGEDLFFLLAQAHILCQKGNYGRAEEIYHLCLTKQMHCLPAIPELFEHLAIVAVCTERPERAAKLFGAAEKMRETIGVVIPPVKLTEKVGMIQRLHETADHSNVLRAWQEGRAMSVDESIPFAMAFVTDSTQAGLSQVEG